jgi:DNA-binding NarL/FixJ family response regulator
MKAKSRTITGAVLMAVLLDETCARETARDEGDNIWLPPNDTANQAAYIVTTLPPVAEPQLQKIQIVERLQFIHESLISWMRLSASGIEVIGKPTSAPPHLPDGERVSAIVVTGHTLQYSPAWFEEERAWLGARRADVPVVAVVPDELAGHSEDWIERFGISGLILSSSSPEVACAVLRLVMAGATYFPRLQSRSPSDARKPVEIRPALLENQIAAKLTIRERDVLYQVERGYPNKMIARELNMSLSTVKAHMHNIIQKLKVKNRTGVAFAARAL